MKHLFVTFYIGIMIVLFFNGFQRFFNGFQRIGFYTDWPNGLQNIAISLIMLMCIVNKK